MAYHRENFDSDRFKDAVRDVLGELQDYQRGEKLFTSRIDGKQYSMNDISSLNPSRTGDRPDYLDMPGTGDPWEKPWDEPMEDYENINRPFNGNTTTYNTPHLDKELILLTCHFNVGTMSVAKAKEQMIDFRGYINSVLEDINMNTKYYIKAFFIHGNESKIECIFPTVNVLPDEIMNKLLNFEGNIEL